MIVHNWLARLLRAATVVTLVAGTLVAGAATATAATTPVGLLDAATLAPGGVRVTGWALEQGNSAPLNVDIYANNNGQQRLLANQSRNDVAAAYPNSGAQHGFGAVIPLPDGTYTICALAIPSAGGAGIPIGCRKATVSSSPLGMLDVVQLASSGSGQQVRVAGWALDPSTTSPISVDIYANNNGQQRLLASANRPDIAAAYPGYGAAHGFNATIPLPDGSFTICTIAVNTRSGSSRQIGCSPIAVSNGPRGNLDLVTRAPGGVQLIGWALDPNTTSPINVDIYANNNGQQRLLANQTRNDVAAAYPGFGAHGFNATIPLADGTYTICAIAINVGLGADQPLGCVQLALTSAPIGSLDVAAPAVLNGAQQAYVAGWAIDPSTGAAANVDFYANNNGVQRILANASRPDVGAAFPAYGSNHGFGGAVPLPDGTSTLCVFAVNSGSGLTTALGCRSITVHNNPVGHLDVVAQVPGGIRLVGWAFDPNTTSPINVDIYANNSGQQRLLASINRPDVAAAYPGNGAAHGFDVVLPLGNGTYTICAIGINVGAGNGNPSLGCLTVTTAFNPHGNVDLLQRPTDTGARVAGWAFDPDSANPVSIRVNVDGQTATTQPAATYRPDISAAFPGVSANHGFDFTFPVAAGEHMVCLTAVNIGPGQDTPLGCFDLIASGATVPTPPASASAVAGYGQATVTWSAPPSTGGAQVGAFRVVASPGGLSSTVPSSQFSTTITGLSPATTYTFSVVAINAVGASQARVTPAVVTASAPAAQTTLPPVSTSRYVRNLGNGANDIAYWRAAGAADAANNPSGRFYTSLLDIGGQSGGGVVLSATSNWQTYAAVVQAMEAYVEGYASAQQPSAPVYIALGTNNDGDVSASTGAAWASQLVNPVAYYAGRYPGITIAGADDIEPGFLAGPAATRDWLNGYLGATGQPFVFNGSADGCNWSAPNGNCNNGWTAADLYMVGAGMAPSRIVALPQIYNSTMSAQWKYISLTGVVNGWPRANIGGALTEVTACQQAGGGCYSMSSTGAWNTLWSDLNSDSRTALGTLPWATDLRIN